MSDSGRLAASVRVLSNFRHILGLNNGENVVENNSLGTEEMPNRILSAFFNCSLKEEVPVCSSKSSEETRIIAFNKTTLDDDIKKR